MELTAKVPKHALRKFPNPQSEFRSYSTTTKGSISIRRFFTGNYPAAASVDGCFSPEAEISKAAVWTEIRGYVCGVS
jgi:hypothetical protein